jgi:hypothetical protein
MATPPSSLIPELADWNNGNGIDLGSWIGHMGDLNLAIGYSTLFWPKFVLFEDLILREGFSPETLQVFIKQCGSEKKSRS